MFSDSSRSIIVRIEVTSASVARTKSFMETVSAVTLGPWVTSIPSSVVVVPNILAIIANAISGSSVLSEMTSKTGTSPSSSLIVEVMVSCSAGRARAIILLVAGSSASRTSGRPASNVCRTSKVVVGSATLIVCVFRVGFSMSSSSNPPSGSMSRRVAKSRRTAMFSSSPVTKIRVPSVSTAKLMPSRA